MTVSQFLAKWGTLILAVIALIQPWVIKLWKRIFPGSLEIFETGALEVGYSSFGPTVGLHGTLGANGADFFVSSASIDLTRLKDRSQHTLNWGAFRSFRVNLGKPEDFAVELPAAILVRQDEPHRYNIQFHDLAVQREVQAILLHLRNQWLEYKTKSLPAQATPQQLRDGFENSFNKTQSTTEAYGKLIRLCYWEAGRYRLRINFVSNHPRNVSAKTWCFTLTEKESDQLRMNVVNAMRIVCDQQPFDFLFAYVAYEHDVKVLAEKQIQVTARATVE